jgi:hypothetical protein
MNDTRVRVIRTRFAPASDPKRAPADQRSGTIVRYGEEFTRYGGIRLIYRQGGISLPDGGPETVKLCVDHDTDRPIGHLTGIEEDADSMRGRFHLPQLQHTEPYRLEMDELLRDGLSVGVIPDQATIDAVDAAMEALFWDGEKQTEPIEVTGTLAEVSTVAVPQFNTARVDQSQEGEPMTKTLITTSRPIDAADAGQPHVEAPAHTRTAAASTRPVSAARALAERIVAARTDSGASGVIAVINTALADITPTGNGAGNSLAGLATQAMGELAEETYTPRYDKIVTKKELTGMKVQGWRWKVLPTVGDYLGNKAEIPTNAATLEWVEQNAQRIAGGHDLDRVYVDLGDAVSVLTSYWRMMSLDLQIKLDAKRISSVQSAAGAAIPVPGGATGETGKLTDAILLGLQAVPDADYLVISADLWAAEGGKPEADLPALLTGAGIFGDMLPDTIVNGVGLTNEVVVGRRMAVDFHEFDPPIRLEAVNIAQAGIDAGLYSYWAAMTTAINAVKRYTLTVAPLARSTADKGK